MDPRYTGHYVHPQQQQQQQQPSHPQPQPQLQSKTQGRPRFSWQLPVDEPSPVDSHQGHSPSDAHPLHPLQTSHAPFGQQHQQHQQQPGYPRFSRPFIQPHHPAIPQSPLSPDTPITPISPTPQDQLAQDKAFEAGPYVLTPPVEPHPATWTPPQEHGQVAQTPVDSPLQFHHNRQFPPQQSIVPPPDQQNTTHDAPPLSPGPLPIKSEREDSTDAQPPSKTTLSTKPIFSPDSLAGPNGTQPALHQPGQIGHPNMEMEGDKDWKHGLCGCGDDVGTCLTGLFCPCIIYGRTAYRLSQKSEKKDPTDLLGWKSVNGPCSIMSVACGLWCLFPLVHRTRIRHMYHLAGSLPSDILRSCCCCCCVVIQNEREVRDREENSRRWAGPSAGPMYTPHGQMVYAPPPRG